MPCVPSLVFRLRFRLALAEVDGNRTRLDRVTADSRFEGGGAHQVLEHLPGLKTYSGVRRRRLAAGALVTAIALAACSQQSKVNARAVIHVAGDAHAADGTALANRPVRLGAGITNAEGGFAALTLG